MMMPSEHNGSAAMPPASPHVNHAELVELCSPSPRSPRGCAVVQPSASETFRTPPMAPGKPESSLKLPLPKMRELHTTHSSRSQSSLFQEILSSQLDLTKVPDDEFFLVESRDANSTSHHEVAPLVRPRAHRVVRQTPLQERIFSETLSSSAPVPLFASIQEDSDTEECFATYEMPDSPCSPPSFGLIDEEFSFLVATRPRQNHQFEYLQSLHEAFGNIEEIRTSSSSKLPVVRLKPRPASLQDGQRAWESFSSFATVDQSNQSST